MSSHNKQIVVEGNLIAYFDVGSGPALVFVHGWLDSRETFTPLIDILKKSYRCIALDLPNFGASQMSESITSLSDFSKLLRSFLEKMQLDDFILIGHSMGGQIGVYAVGQNIVSPKKLILLASAGVRNTQTLRRSFFRYLSKPLKYLVPSKVKDRLYKNIGSDYSSTLTPVHKKIINQVLTTDVQAYAARITVPTLLIFGGEDSHTTVAMGETLKSVIKDAELIMLDDQDHWLHKTASSEVAHYLEEFIS